MIVNTVSSVVRGSAALSQPQSVQPQGQSSFAATLATVAGATTYSDSELKSAFAGVSTPAALAKQAATLGLNESQIQRAIQVCGFSTQTSSKVAENIENWVGDAGNGYEWDANGVLTSIANQQVAAQSVTGQSTDGMTLAGKYFSRQQLKDFYAQGRSMNQYLQQQGVTDLWQIHSMNAQAQQIAGDSVPTGETALKLYFKQYQQYNPNGAHATDYAGWKNDQDPVTVTSMMSGGYTGAVSSCSDNEPGGIYGPGSAYYGKPGYASGLGPRGMGSLGGGWAADGNMLNPAT